MCSQLLHSSSLPATTPASKGNKNLPLLIQVSLLTLPWGRGLQPGFAGDKVLHTQRSILGLKEGLFFSKDTGAGGKEHPPQCPCPGALSCVLLFPGAASSWAGFTPALFSCCLHLHAEDQPLTEGSLCPGHSQCSWQERDGQRPPVLVTTEHPQSSSAPSYMLLIPHSLQARSYTDSTESQNH